MAEQVPAPSDMTIRERSVYLEQLGSPDAAGMLARYIRRTALPWHMGEGGQHQTVPVSADLLNEVSSALMGLDSRLIRGLEDAIANGPRRALSGREACAAEWIEAHGYDEHGVAAWLRSGG